MKRTRKNTLLLLLFILMFTVPFFIAPIVNAEGTAGNIRYSWINATVDPFSNLPSGPQRLVQEVGGYDLISFENLGIFSEDESTGTIIFNARATFGFELNSYTAVTHTDMFPELNIDRKVEYTYLKLRTKPAFIFPLPFHDYKYSIEAIDLYYGSVQNTYRYFGENKITLDINPEFDEDFTIGNIDVVGVKYTYDILSVAAVVIESGETGSYKDKYSDPIVSEGSVSSMSLSKSSFINSKSQYLDNLNLGWKIGNRLIVNNQSTTAGSNTEGATWNNPSKESLNKPFSIDVHTDLQPGVTKTREKIIVRYGSVIFFLLTGNIIVKEGPLELTKTRDISVHINNQFVHQEFEVVVNFQSIIKLDADLYELSLDDPYFKRGDWNWDPTIGGTTKVTLVANDHLFDWLFDMFEWIIWIVVGIVVVVITFLVLKVTNTAMKLKLASKRIGGKK